MRGIYEGSLSGLEIHFPGPDEPAGYILRLGSDLWLPLNGVIGCGVSIDYQGVIVCMHCHSQGKKSYGGGYCYQCFTTLARCDLCVVSPDRCHYHLGTCREPAWGEAFCMQPHVVYLANTSGIKVGITRRGRERKRWLDQGAIQGLVILTAESRRAAGLAEAAIAGLIPDRTNWRKMLRADVPELDLTAVREQVREAVPDLPADVRWARDEQVVRLRYPLEQGEPPAKTLLLREGPVRGNLLGMKGQYLVLTSGAFNVRQHAGYQVRVEISESIQDSPAENGQIGLF